KGPPNSEVEVTTSCSSYIERMKASSALSSAVKAGRAALFITRLEFVYFILSIPTVISLRVLLQ
ncbi:hypothetical protein J6590_095169, partial [Homalodisca vitripennis]